MTRDYEYSSGLALGYIQGILSDEEKTVVQHLIVNNTDFLQVLKKEIVFKKMMQTLKEPLPLSISERVYANIKTNRKLPIYEQALATVLKATLPNVAWPVFKLLQRSGYVHEQ